MNQASRKKETFIPAAVLKKHIERYAKKKYTSLGFLGGEPTIYPGITDIISFARRAGFSHVHLVSNGRRLADEHYLAELIAAGVTRISVSIHGGTAVLEDTLTRVPGGFDQKIRALHHLAAARKKGALPDGVSINIVLTAQNLTHVPAMIKKFHNIGMRDFRINYCRPEGIPLKICRDLLPKYSEIVPVLARIMRAYPSTMVSFEGIPLCIVPALPGALGYIGELKDSFDTVFAFNKDTPAAMKSCAEFSWKRERADGLKKKVAVCRSCALRSLCEGVYVNYVRLFGSSELSPVCTPGKGRQVSSHEQLYMESSVQDAVKAIIKVGYACNNDCLFCHVDVPPHKRKNATTGQVRRMVGLAARRGCGGVLFSGGEITVRDDLFELAAAVRSKGLFFGLITNGRRLQDPALVSRLVAAGLRYVYLSFMSSDRKVQERLTGADSYAEVVRAIRTLSAMPVFLKVNITVTSLNLPTLESTLRLLRRAGVRRVKLSFVEPKGRAAVRHQLLVPRMSVVWKKIVPLIKRYRSSMQIGLDGFPLCMIKGHEDLLDDLFTEHILYMSEAYEPDLWPTDRGTKVKPDLCRTCAAAERCPGIYEGYLRTAGSTEFEPI